MGPNQTPATPFQTVDQQVESLDARLGPSPFQSVDDQVAALNQRIGAEPTAAEGFIKGQVERGELPREALTNPMYQAYIETEADPFDAVAKLNASKYFSDSLGLDFGSALANYDSISSAWYGQARSPMTAWESIKDSYELGKYSYELGNLWSKKREGTASPEDEARILELENTMPPADRFHRSLPVTILKAAANSIPYSASAMAGGYAGELGATALASLIFPEGALAIGAISTIGRTVGSMAASYNSMAGLEYRDMIKAGMNPNIAATASRWSGLLQSAVESDQVMGLLPSSAAKESLVSAAQKVIGEGLLKGRFREPLLKFLLRQGTRAFSEGGEEVTQQIISEIAFDVARKASTNAGAPVDGHSWDEVKDQIVQNFIGGALASLPLGALGEPMEIAQDVGDWKAYLSTEKAKNDAKRGQTAPAAGAAGRAINPDESAPVQTAAGSFEPGMEYRDESGRIYSEITNRSEREEGDGSAVVEARLKVGDPENKQTYAYIDHTLRTDPQGQETIVIDRVDYNRPGEAETVTATTAQDGAGQSASEADIPAAMKGLFKEAFTELASRYPGVKIEWNTATPMENAIKEELEAESPTHDLQWFYPDRPAAEQLTRQEARRQIMQAFQGDRHIAEETDGILAIVDRLAEKKGLNADAMLGSVFEGQAITRTGTVALNKEGTADAGISFRDASGREAQALALSRADLGRIRAVVKLGKTADFAAFSHEFFHAIERLWFDDNEVASFERAIGKRRAAWAVSDLEYLADQWEHYLETGLSPDEGLKPAFSRLAQALRRFLAEFVGLERRYGERYALSPELREAYDSLLAKPESGLARASGPEVTKEGRQTTPTEKGEKIIKDVDEGARAVQPDAVQGKNTAEEEVLGLFHDRVTEPNENFESDFQKLSFVEMEIPSDLASLTRPELRAVAVQKYASLQGGAIQVPGLGAVRLTSSGKGKTFHNSADPVKLFALLKIRELLEQSVSLGRKAPIDPAAERNVRWYHYRASKFRLENREYIVGTTIKEQSDGTLYYNSTVYNMETPESRAIPTVNVGGVLPGDQNPASAELNISVRKVFPGVKGFQDESYLSHTRSDLAAEAASFDSPEEYRSFVEGMFGDKEDALATEALSEEERADFYRKLWEEGKAKELQAEKAAKAAALEGDPDADFLARLRRPGGVESFLEELWGAAAYVTQAGQSGIADEEEYAEVERLSGIRDQIDREAHPTLKAAMLTVGRNGRHLTESTRKRVLSLIGEGVLDYRTLDAEIRNDQETLEGLRSRTEERTKRFGVLPEPANASTEGLTIAGRARLERASENEEIRKKIRTGEITPKEIEQLVGDLDKEKAQALAERNQLREERTKLEDQLDDRESDWVHSNQLLMDARAEISKADAKIERLAKRAALDPDALEAELRERKTLASKLDTLEKAMKQKTAALRQADRAKAAAAKIQAVKSAEARVRAIEQRKKAAIDLRQEKIRIGEEITRERSLKYVNHAEWEQIRRIQSVVDPNFRRATIAWRGEMIEISKLREDPELLRDVLRDSGLAEKLKQRLETKPLNEWSLNELQEVKKQVDQLEKLGRDKLAAKRAEDRAKATTIGTRLLSTIEQSKDFEGSAPYGSAELEKKLKRKDRKNFSLLTFFDMDRVATFFDGGKPGGFHEILVDRHRVAQNHEIEGKERREAEILKIVNDKKIDLAALKRKDIAIDLGISDYGTGERTATLSKEDLMFAMIALRDYGGGKPMDWLGSRGAYIFGNFFDENEKLRKKEGGEYEVADLTLKHFGSRVEAAIKKAIADNLGPAELELADAMSADWAENYGKLRQAMIDHYNQEVVKVEHYIPLRRQSSAYTSLESELLEEHANLAGLTTSPNKGNTVERIKIGIRHQLPVRTDILNLYFDSVRKSEHLIAYADYFKTANRVFKRSDLSKELRQKMRLTWGEGSLRYVDNYLSELANPQEFKALTNVEKAFRFLRGNQAVAYLGLRLSSVVKQVLTSPIPFVTYSGPAYFAKASYEAMADPLHFQAQVEEMSPYLRSRHGSWFADALRGAGDPKAIEAVKKVQGIIMKPLEWADSSTVAIGWYAVYMKAKADGMAEEAARTQADDITHKTQPSSNPADLAPLFKEGGEFAKVFTTFQMPMSRIFQQAFFDLPNAIKNKEYRTAFGIAIAYALSGLALTLVTGAKGDDEEKKQRDWIFSAFSQFTDSVPFIGNMATDLARTAITGDREARLSSSLLPAAEKSLGGLASTVDALWGPEHGEDGQGHARGARGSRYRRGRPNPIHQRCRPSD